MNEFEIQDKIKKFLEKNGIEVFRYDRLIHGVGLPEYYIGLYVFPAFYRADKSIISIVNDRIGYYNLNSPYMYNSWYCVESKTYNSKEESIKIIKDLSGENKANLWLD